MYANATDVIDENAADEAVYAILRFLDKQDIITANTPPGYITKLIYESKTKQIRSEAAGVFKSCIEIGKRVERGDVLGTISDPFDGETVSEIRSPVSGTVYFEYFAPLINSNTVCFKIIK